ncbi:hypothetical protein [Sulfurovum sp. TSL1]|uniref:hypothetical protein n=1 Tax=Sulfurovum sp. TSL1 TaxID=2826994 RepID=UPI001CC57EFD|nr:hypothetical protein [Sulfurovum sp. TSL1]
MTNFNSFHTSRYGTHIKPSINQQVENRYNNCQYAFPRTTWERENCYINNKEAHRFWEKEGYEVIALHFQKKFENV